MTLSKPGIVSGAWKEWDGIGGPEGSVMVALGARHDLDDAEKSLRRLGIEYSREDQHVDLVFGWIGTEGETDEDVLYACDVNGTTDTGAVVNKASITYVTFSVLLDNNDN